MSMREILVRHIRWYMSLWAIAFLLSLACMGLVILGVRPNDNLLNTLIQAIVQLISFGGIMVGIFYPQQRTLIRRLRLARLGWAERLALFDAKPEEYVAKGLTRAYLGRAIANLNLQITEARDKWHLTIALFAFAFLVLGSDLMLLVFHLSNTGYVTNSTLVRTTVTSLSEFAPLLEICEIYLFSVGVVILLYAFVRGAITPEGPVGSGTRSDELLALGQNIAEFATRTPDDM
jgi:hypothetical protein